MRKNSPLAFSPLIKCFIKHLLTGAFLDTVPQVCFPKLISISLMIEIFSYRS